MTGAVFAKLLAIIATVGLGWLAGRLRWLGDKDADPVRVLSAAAFTIFVPALLFRTSARLDLGALPGGLLIAYFVPALAYLGVVYALARRGNPAEAAAPATRAITATYGNAVQMGIPMSAAMFGEAGLGLHLMLVSVHGLILLSVLTALVETDLARRRAASGGGAWQVLGATLRNTLIHPVVLPVLLGLAWNLSGLGLLPVLDEVLAMLGSAVVPLCLVLIGLSLAHYGAQGHLRGAFGVTLLKLLVLPALVLVVARWGFGLGGLPLSVLVMLAALPVGSNALIFAQRYRTLQGEATAAIVLSTLAFMLSAPLWLALLGRLGA
jgi:malonate transporter and related proteins